ncbi:hypothetical protein BHM03_00035166 [Ensete ventricosum]|nr:hypothetical protein BHM03_00035166 [Ensete ventricosum]
MAASSGKQRWAGAVKQVTKSNFAAALQQLRTDVDSADFVAISCRKTGDSVASSRRHPWHRVLPIDTPEVAYLKARLAAESYEILQFAVCPFRLRGHKVLAYPYELKRELQQIHEVFMEDFELQLMDKTCAAIVFSRSGLAEALLKEMGSGKFCSDALLIKTSGLRAVGYDAYRKVCMSGLWEADLADSLENIIAGSTNSLSASSEKDSSEVYWGNSTGEFWCWFNDGIHSSIKLQFLPPVPLGEAWQVVKPAIAAFDDLVRLEEMLEASASRKRHTTAQSSVLPVGYFCLQALTADWTRHFAAEDRDGAEATMSTTSLLDSTSQICCIQLAELTIPNI